jgi:aspartate racemase
VPRGTAAEASVAELQAMVRALKAEGCDAVVLGCTELPLVLGDHNAALPTLDSTRLLARAALRRAVRSG